MPVYNWMQINEAYEVKYMLKKSKSVGFFGEIALSLMWKDLYNQYIDKFGFTEEFVAILDKKYEIALKKLEQIQTGDKSLNAIINISEQELTQMLKGGKKASFMDIKVHLEKFLGFHLNLKEVTVTEFYAYLEQMKKHGRENNKA